MVIIVAKVKMATVAERRAFFAQYKRQKRKGRTASQRDARAPTFFGALACQEINRLNMTAEWTRYLGQRH